MWGISNRWRKFSLGSHLAFRFVIISFSVSIFFSAISQKKWTNLHKQETRNERTANVSIQFHVLLIFRFSFFAANDHSPTSIWFLRLHVGAYPCQLPSDDLHYFWLFWSISVQSKISDIGKFLCYPLIHQQFQIRPMLNFTPIRHVILSFQTKTIIRKQFIRLSAHSMNWYVI